MFLFILIQRPKSIQFHALVRRFKSHSCNVDYEPLSGVRFSNAESFAIATVLSHKLFLSRPFPCPTILPCHQSYKL